MPDLLFVCGDCHNQLTAKDWACPRCGAIADRYLFNTVTLKSLEGESRNAYHRGYKECRQQAKHTGSWVIQPENYRPVRGYETAYRAGWQAASSKLEARADRKFGRRRGVRVLGSGVAALFLTVGFAWMTGRTLNNHVMEWLLEHLYLPIGLGAVNVVLGIVMILTGANDEARPS